MFASERIFIVPNKIGDVQLALLKKRVEQHGGQIVDKISLDTNRIISNLPTLENVFEVVSPSTLNPSALFHSTEWISRSLARSSKCPDDAFVIPGRFGPSTAASPLMPDPDPSLLLKLSNGSLSQSDEMMRRSSSSKIKYEDLKVGDPSFGLKIKSATKKRTRNDQKDTPPDEITAKASYMQTEEEEDGSTPHSIRKRAKYSESEQHEKHHASIDGKSDLIESGRVATLELVYDLETAETSDSAPPSWDFLMFRRESPVKRVVETHTNTADPAADEHAVRPAALSKTVSIPPESILSSLERTSSIVSPIIRKESSALSADACEQITFTGDALPRMMVGPKSTEDDDIEDPKFLCILKPAPDLDREAIEDEFRYQGPLAIRPNLIADIRAAIQDVHATQDLARTESQLSRRLNESTDSQENDFSDSHAIIDEQEFKKNFGHNTKPLPPHWERQRKKLACQKVSPSKQQSAVPTELLTTPEKLLKVESTEKLNHNKLITEQLEKLEAICLGSGDKWRAYAYRRAANILKSLSYKIESMEDALKLRGIGTSIAEKIGEIIATGKLRKLDALQNEERIQTLSLFMGIFGVGQSTANKWCAQGYKTLEDLQKHATLTFAQAIGIKYYHEFQQRIPRAEMEQIWEVIKRVMATMDPDFIVEICGSYRRGKSDCGDVDIIITHKRPAPLKSVLYELVPKLHEAKLLTHDFVSISEDSDKYMGVCQATPTGLHRRIDLLTVPPTEWPFALLYFTGSGHFNRSMRFWAGKRGYSLSQHGLRVNYGNDVKGPYIAGITTEKQIFEALGLDYRPPQDREV